MRLRLMYLLLILGLVGGAENARSAKDEIPTPPGVQGLYAQFEGEGGKAEVSGIVAFSPEEAAMAEALLSESLAEALKNPDVKTQILATGLSEESLKTVREAAERIAKGTKTPITEVQMPAEAGGFFKKLYKSWYEKYYRITFTLVRSIQNGSIAGWSLMASQDIPFGWDVAFVGAVAGSMCAGFQWFNKRFLAWLTNDRPPEVEPTIKERAHDLKRWWGAELWYTTILKSVFNVVGLDVPSSIFEKVFSIVWTATLSTASQAWWDLSFSDSSKLAKVKNPENENTINFVTDLKTLVISGMAVAVSAAGLLDIPLAKWGFIGLGAAGILSYGKTFLKLRAYKKSLKEQELKTKEKSCEDKLVSQLFVSLNYA
jgi:hypothetical protein